MMNVLIVDDSRVTRTMIRRVLGVCGVETGEVHEAGNGQEAIEVLAQHAVDLALVDVNMPIMNGEQLLEQIRSTPELKELPVLMVSTEGSETRVNRFKELGASFLQKPFAPERLRDLIQEVIGGSHA